MRNTIKFLHPMHFAIIVLCGYGVEGVIRLARQESEAGAALIKKWVMGFAITARACLLLSLILGASKGLLADHIAGRGFSPEAPPRWPLQRLGTDRLGTAFCCRRVPDCKDT